MRVKSGIVCSATRDHESRIVEAYVFFCNLENLLEVDPEEINMDVHIALKMFIQTFRKY